MKVFETDWDVKFFFCKTLCKISDSIYSLHSQRDVDLNSTESIISLFSSVMRDCEIPVFFISNSVIPFYRYAKTHLWTDLIFTICSFDMSLKVLPLLFWSIARNLRYCLLSIVFFIKDFRLFFCSIVR